MAATVSPAPALAIAWRRYTSGAAASGLSYLPGTLRHITEGGELTDRHERDRDIAAAYRDGASMRQAAERFGVSPTEVMRALRRTQTPSRAPGRSRAVDDACVVELHTAGRTQAEIAAELGIHPVSVRRVYRRHGIDGRAPAARRRQKVDRTEARDLLARLGNQSEVARQLGVSAQTIHRIAHADR